MAKQNPNEPQDSDDLRFIDPTDTTTTPVSEFPVVTMDQVPVEELERIKVFETGETDEEGEPVGDDLGAMYLALQRAKRDAVEKGVLRDARDSFDMDFLDDFEYQGKMLNFRQKLFVAEFLIDLQPKPAALRAGYAPGTAAHAKERLVQCPVVREAIRIAIGKRMLRLRISADRVVQELAKIAFANLTDVVEFQGNVVTIKDAKDIPPDKRAAIREITETRGPNGTTISVKMHDKKTALDSLARHLGLFNDKLEITTSEEAANELTRARERVINAKRNAQGDFETDIDSG